VVKNLRQENVKGKEKGKGKDKGKGSSGSGRCQARDQAKTENPNWRSKDGKA